MSSVNIDVTGVSDVSLIRRDACDIFTAAVASVYPPQMVKNAIKVSPDGNQLTVDGHNYALKQNVYVVGFGKAVSGMAAALDQLIGKHIVDGIISIPYGTFELFTSIGKSDLCVKPDSKIRVFQGARYNMPDEDSHKAATAIHELAKSLTEKHILIVLISGGGSSLLPSPIPPVTLDEAIKMTRVISEVGGSIGELNILRQNVEVLKGGGLAMVARPAQVLSLILSDVIEDKLEIISSGPTTPLLSSARQCLQILERLNVKDKVPRSVVELLMRSASDKKSQQEGQQQHNLSYESQWKHVQNVIIGSNTIATEAARNQASRHGYVPVVLTNTLQGEASRVAGMFVMLAKYIMLSYGNMAPDKGKGQLVEAELELIKDGLKKSDLQRVIAAVSQAQNSHSGLCVICGGETTVMVKGSGKGGRNQEMALTFSLGLKNMIEGTASHPTHKQFSSFHVEFLSAGTDGQDGPTDAAGAVVNKRLVQFANGHGLDASAFLKNNDSYTFFKSLKDDSLLETGLTGTNVMDIQLLIIKFLSK
ncbi:glycerate kinase-like [Dreissena polymorpha]|nr:glycerate kinase-like [Dreissena polymorpha]